MNNYVPASLTLFLLSFLFTYLTYTLIFNPIFNPFHTEYREELFQFLTRQKLHLDILSEYGGCAREGRGSRGREMG